MRNVGAPPNRPKNFCLPIIRAGPLFLPLMLGVLVARPLLAQSKGDQPSGGQVFIGRSSPASDEPPSTPSGPLPVFDAISVKRSNRSDPRGGIQLQPGGRWVMTNFPVRLVISVAYGLTPDQGRGGAMTGAPDWVDTERYDIEAKAEGDPTNEQMRLMLQPMLADRFKLAVHWETREMPVFALTMAKPGKTGPQLVPHAADNSTCQAAPPIPPAPPARPSRPPCGGGFFVGPGRLIAESTMDNLAKNLSWRGPIDRKVVDKTGLGGVFDLSLTYAPFIPGVGAPEGSQDANDSSLPSSIFTALQEQLGLRLVPQKGPVEILVIDHIERPSEN
jgi:uncharacterized protein (TIGR03435 family)